MAPGASHLSTGRPENRRKGPEHELEVQPERPPVDVLQVEGGPAGEGAVPIDPLRHSPDARQPGAHAEPAPWPEVVLGDLRRQRRAWADDAHVAEQHVD